MEEQETLGNSKHYLSWLKELGALSKDTTRVSTGSLVKQIIDEEGVSVSQASKKIKDLREKGFLMYDDPEEGYHVWLTDKGIQLLRSGKIQKPMARKEEAEPPPPREKREKIREHPKAKVKPLKRKRPKEKTKPVEKTKRVPQISKRETVEGKFQKGKQKSNTKKEREALQTEKEKPTKAPTETPVSTAVEPVRRPSKKQPSVKKTKGKKTKSAPYIGYKRHLRWLQTQTSGVKIRAFAKYIAKEQGLSFSKAWSRRIRLEREGYVHTSQTSKGTIVELTEEGAEALE